MNLISELKKTMVLAFPIIAGHVSHMLLGFTDTLMIGRIGVTPLAAAAFTSMVLHIFFIVGVGMLTSVSVLASHAYGAQKYEEAGEVLRRGFWISLVLGVLIVLSIWYASHFLGYLGQPPGVIEEARPYLLILGFSLLPAIIYICFKNFSEALDSPWPAFWVGLGGVLLNVFLNWVLIYGNLGAPAMGLTGAGWATLISRVLTAVVFVIMLYNLARFREVWPTRWLARIPFQAIRNMLHLGVPVSMQLLVEIGSFAVATYLMGLISEIALASHQVAITCAATSFMFPLGISIAVSIRVGHAIGAGRMNDARGIGLGALGMGCAIMAVFALIFVSFNETIASWFTTDPVALQLTAGLLIIASVFQLADGAQVVAIGALRGSKDVNTPTWIVFAAYWVIGLPSGYILGFFLDFGPYGIWVGMALGLISAAIGLTTRFVLRTRVHHQMISEASENTAGFMTENRSP